MVKKKNAEMKENSASSQARGATVLRVENTGDSMPMVCFVYAIGNCIFYDDSATVHRDESPLVPTPAFTALMILLPK
jgi:hypothetical protein